MNKKTDKFADVLRLLKLMGEEREDQPQLEQACLTLLIDHDNSDADAAKTQAKAQLQYLRQQQSENEPASDTAATSALESEPVPEATAKPTRLPRLSRQNDWRFSFPYLSNYQQRAATARPLLDQLSKTQPHQLTKSDSTHRSHAKAPVNNSRALWQQLFKRLGLPHLSALLDEHKLSKIVAQKQPVTALPFKQPRRVDKETWLFIDQSEKHYPLYSDFKQFIDQVYRHLGQGTLNKVFEITDFSGPRHWRIRPFSGQLIDEQSGPLPLPHNRQQVIILGDPLSFASPRWQYWLKQLKTLSSLFVQITTRPQPKALYLGKPEELDLAKQQWQALSHATATQPAITPAQYAKEQLLALLSITPARFTLAMLRELRQTITGGSLALEVQLFNHPDLLWQRATDNGYWASPPAKYREAFKQMPATQQKAAIDIIIRHLPEKAQSLSHEVFLLLPQLLNPALIAAYESPIAAAKQTMLKIASKLQNNEAQPEKNAHYLDHFYKMACRLSRNADDISDEGKQVLTIMNWQAQQLIPELPMTQGIDPQLYQELQQQQQQPVPGNLIQQGDRWRVTADPQIVGRPLAALQDISNILLTTDTQQYANRQKTSLTATQTFTPSAKAKTLEAPIPGV